MTYAPRNCFWDYIRNKKYTVYHDKAQLTPAPLLYIKQQIQILH